MSKPLNDTHEVEIVSGAAPAANDQVSGAVRPRPPRTKLFAQIGAAAGVDPRTVARVLRGGGSYVVRVAVHDAIARLGVQSDLAEVG